MQKSNKSLQQPTRNKTFPESRRDRWKWFLPGPRSSLNPPGPPEKAKNLSFGTQNFTEKLGKNSLYSLLTPFLGGPPRGDGPAW